MFDTNFVTNYYSMFINQSDIFRPMILRDLRDDLIKYYNNNEKLEDIKTIATSIIHYTSNFDNRNNERYRNECENIINCINRLLIN